MFGLILAACSSNRFVETETYTVPKSSKIDVMPLPPPRPFDLPKKCWVETETTQHAVIERRYCR